MEIFALLFGLFLLWFVWKIFCYCFRVLVRIAKEEWTKVDAKEKVIDLKK